MDSLVMTVCEMMDDKGPLPRGSGKGADYSGEGLLFALTEDDLVASYNKTKDPITLLMWLFLFLKDPSLFAIQTVPPEVREWFTSGIIKWLKGSSNMEQALGLAKGKGKRSSRRIVRGEYKQLLIVLVVDILRVLFRLNRQDAFEIAGDYYGLSNESLTHTYTHLSGYKTKARMRACKIVFSVWPNLAEIKKNDLLQEIGEPLQRVLDRKELKYKKCR